ncbi:restriction endonuclease subunit S [Helicobacter aurati]|nr:restriction endonuclease subunit S [Helicobacter aurati]
MNKNLESMRWGEFVVGEIFDFAMRGKRLIERDRVKGNIPYYSASKESNGLTDMIANPLFIAKNKLIISTFCDCYYVEGEFTASDEITIFGNDKLNKHNGLFIARIVKSNASKYAFGYKAFSERLMKQIIMLPIDSKGEPNYKFMESFMRKLEQKHLQKILAYYTHKLESIGGGADFLFVALKLALIILNPLVILSVAKNLAPLVILRKHEVRPKNPMRCFATLNMTKITFVILKSCEARLKNPITKNPYPINLKATISQPSLRVA